MRRCDKKGGTKMKRRIFGVVLILSMLLSVIIVPGNVFAEGTGGSDPAETADGILLNQVNIIHFYDWDGTYLGDNLFWAIGGKEAAYRAVEEFSRKNYAGGYTVDNSTHEDRYVDDASKPLTYKKGYNFGGWVEVTPETLDSTFTAYATEEEINADIKDFRNDSLNFNGNGAYVKAAYVGNETLDTGVQGSIQAYYIFSDYTYDKLDTQMYGIEFTVKRENVAGYGVTRLIKPVISVRATVGDEEFYMPPYQLTGQDEQRVMLEVPRESNKISIAVQDNGTGRRYLMTNHVSAFTEFKAKEPSPLWDSNISKGYKVEGTLTYVNNVLIDTIQELKNGNRKSAWTVIAYSTFDDMNLSEIVSAQNTGTEGMTDSNLAGIARHKIMLYSVANGKRKLTYEEIEQAIQMNTGTHLENIKNADFVSYMQPKVEAVYQESQANYGGVMTTQELEAYINANF